MRLQEVAEITGGWVAPENYEVEVHGPASLDDAAEGDFSFYGNPKYLKSLRRSKATMVLVPHGFAEDVGPVRIWVDNPAESFAKLLEKFAPTPVIYSPGVHPTAVVAEGVSLGEGVHVGPHAVVEAGASIGAGTVLCAGTYIGQGVSIGENCHFHPKVTVLERCKIGNRVILHSGAVIGSDGFGYEFRNGKHEKIPQTGIVEIGDDVEIGANTTVDRARFGRTRILQGAKLDNLVQVAHNVNVGAHTILCAQVGISGSTRVGNYVTLAGKVGVNGHIEIGDGAIVTAMAGITKTVPPKEVLVGLPAKPMREYKENYVLLHNIHKLYERVKKLEDGSQNPG